MTDKKEKKFIKVDAPDKLVNRRLITLPGISKKQYRDLKAGKAVSIESKYFNPLFMREVKDGDK